MNNADKSVSIFLENLQELRGDKNLTEFANGLNYSQPFITGWFNRSRCPKVEDVFRIAEMYNVSPAWLLGFSKIKDATTNDVEAQIQNELSVLADILDGKSLVFESGGYSAEKYVITPKNQTVYNFIRRYKKIIEIYQEDPDLDLDGIGDEEEMKKKRIEEYVVKINKKQANIETGGVEE
jgi:transcriptional regulator with XRE-family HTH domain